MRFNFQKEISDLKKLDRDRLYQTFHQIQSEVLHPQWRKHFGELMGEQVRALELYGPRSPQKPKNYSSQVIDRISNSSGKDTLWLNHVIGYLDDPTRVLSVARELGTKTIVLHEVPKDGTFKYEFFPEKFRFGNQDLTREGSKNLPLELLIQNALSTGWEVLSDTRLDFIYETEVQKLSLVKMELALDLIDHYFAGRPSRFDDLSQELENWFSLPSSKLVVRGCSRWLVLQ